MSEAGDLGPEKRIDYQVGARVFTTDCDGQKTIVSEAWMGNGRSRKGRHWGEIR